MARREKSLDKYGILSYPLRDMKSFFQRTVYGPNYKWWGLGIVSIAVFASTADSGLVGISLPVIMNYFQADMSFAGWVVLIHSLVTACLFVPLGRLSDLIGHKKIMSAGFLLYATSSAVASLAQNPTQLITFRILQATGNALMMSNSFAITTALFPGNERGKAMGISGGLVSAVGLSLGPSMGGLLIHAFGWRSVFYVPAIIGGVGFIAAQFLIQEHRMTIRVKKTKEPFDFLGMGIFVLALSSLFVGLTTGQKGLWNSPLVIAELTIAVMSVSLFIWWESFTRYPMLDLKLFSIRTFTGGNWSRLSVFIANSVNNLIMPFYLQLGLGLSPLAAGLLMTPNAMASAVVSPISGWLSDKIGARIISSLGLAVTSAALFMLSSLSAGATSAEVVRGILLFGVGHGLFQTPNNSSVMGSVPPERLGVASAFLSLVRSLGQSFGIAIATTIIISSLIAVTGQTSLQGLREAGQAGQNPALLSAFLRGYRFSYIAAGLICAFAIVASLSRGPRESKKE